MEKRWKILPYNHNQAEELQKALNINFTICKILVQRDITSFELAKKFFRPQLNQLHNPWLMKDMGKAVDRIIHAFASKEKILVFGDYDVDGTSSVASLLQFLNNIYPNASFYIPHRYREGYGISKAGIEFAIKNKFSLIISVDCGIKSIDLIQYAKDAGIDFIICDHHMPDQILPSAVAILNPKQIDCNYPFKELCGCGVVFKLMMALTDKLQLPEESYLQYIDLAATAIAADIVPVNDENRLLAFFGLQKVNSNPSIGIKALMQLAKVEKQMHISNLVFIIAPRINAAGRMDDAKKAVQLFIEKDIQKATTIAEQLHIDNTDRKEADANITQEALAMLHADENNTGKKTTLVYQPHWHKGVVGIVASRLIDSYYRPTIVLTKSGDYVAGSARSVPGFNLYEAIHQCREHLIGYGGHFAAAGMTLAEENVHAFASAFEEVVSKTIAPECLVPEIIIDAEISFNNITLSLYNILSQMEPFGPENLRPVFIAKKVLDTGFSKIVKEQHIRFSLKQENTMFNGIGFNLSHKFHLLQMNAPIDVVFTIDENEWNGEKTLQLKVLDIKLSV